MVDDLESASAVSLQMADDAGAIALPSPHEEDMLDIKAEDFDITKYVVGSEPDVPDVMSACGFEEHSSSISSPKQIENVNVKHERDARRYTDHVNPPLHLNLYMPAHSHHTRHSHILHLV